MNKTTAIASLGIVIVALMEACGSSVSTTGPTGAGGTGTGAMSTSAGTGASTGTSTTTTMSAGGATTTSTSATSSVGSSSSGGPTCPGTAPNNGAACTMAGESCPYNGGALVCDCAGMAAMLTWDCHVCPAMQPAANAACPGEAGDTCMYGAMSCTCGPGAGVGSGDRWTCGTCPTAQPANNATCTPVDLHCAYSGTDCTCEGFAGPAGGGGDRWVCNTPCPAMQPTAGSDCNVAAGKMCPYGNTTCECQTLGMGKPDTWFCN